MLTLKDYRGIERQLSDEVYVTTQESGYLKGTKVRLISGVDESSIVGYHFSEGFVTICRIDATIAEFIGIRRQYLQLPRSSSQSSSNSSSVKIKGLRPGLKPIQIKGRKGAAPALN